MPWQFVWVGAQTPEQTPPTHVWFVHATVDPQVPVVSHFCVPLSVVHCTAPGEHSTHAPFQQTAVVPEHVVWFSHLPELLHC